MGLFNNNNSCYNGGQQHKFTPRFERVKTGIQFEGENFSSEEIEKILFTEKYLFDICVWCGKKIEKD